jgi:hypothetical protein
MRLDPHYYWFSMKIYTFLLSLTLALFPMATHAVEKCAIKGEASHWQMDYCRARNVNLNLNVQKSIFIKSKFVKLPFVTEFEKKRLIDVLLIQNFVTPRFVIMTLVGSYR